MSSESKDPGFETPEYVPNTRLAACKPNLAAANLPGICRVTVAVCSEGGPLHISSAFVQTSPTSFAPMMDWAIEAAHQGSRSEATSGFDSRTLELFLLCTSAGAWRLLRLRFAREAGGLNPV